LYRHLSEIFFDKPLSFIIPVPFFNVLNGGVHSGNEMAFQEFMLARAGAASFREAMQIECECFQKLKEILVQNFGAKGMSCAILGLTFSWRR
jgi:enolase